MGRLRGVVRVPCAAMRLEVSSFLVALESEGVEMLPVAVPEVTEQRGQVPRLRLLVCTWRADGEGQAGEGHDEPARAAVSGGRALQGNRGSFGVEPSEAYRDVAPNTGARDDKVGWLGICPCPVGLRRFGLWGRSISAAGRGK